MNAICHRDYTIPGGAVSVAIFEDRLEVINTGKLAAGVQIEDLKRDHESLPRNPVIAEVFYRRGLIEKWGRGTQKILEICKAAGSPEPEFEERAGAVVVRFFTRPERAEQGPTPPELTDRQRTVLECVPPGTAVSTGEIAGQLGGQLSERTLRRELDALTSQGLLVRSGWGRGVRYSRGGDSR